MTQLSSILLSDRLLKCRNEPGLSDTRFTGNEHHTTIARFNLRPPALKQLQLLLAPYKRNRLRSQRREAIVDACLVQHRPRLDRLIEALEVGRSLSPSWNVRPVSGSSGRL